MPRSGAGLRTNPEKPINVASLGVGVSGTVLSDPKIQQLIPASGWRIVTVGIMSSPDATRWEEVEDVVAFALFDDGEIVPMVAEDGAIVSIQALSGPNTCYRLIGPSKTVTEELKNLMEANARNCLADIEASRNELARNKRVRETGGSH